MKKTFFKILTTIVIIALVVILQGYVQSFFNIDPRIWFIVLYVLSVISLFVITDIFKQDFEQIRVYFSNHTFCDFYNEYIKKYITILKDKFDKLKEFVNKIFNSFIYTILSTLNLFIVSGLLWYHFFFNEDFLSRPILIIILLIGTVLLILNYLGELLFNTVSKKQKEFCIFTIVLYIIIFILFLLKYISLY